MIFGRSPSIVLGFLTASFNVVVAFHLGGIAPTLDQIAIVNVFLGAFVVLVANSPEIAVHAGVKAISRLNNAAPDDETPGTAYANKVINGDGIKVINAPVEHAD